MGLNKSNGNMYEFITHTYNVIKGQCYHDCSYCYMKRWGKLRGVRFDYTELKTDLGKNNFIFIGSSCDMWAETINSKWIKDILNHVSKYQNKYLLQTKNPKRILEFIDMPFIKDNVVVCTTIETNRYYKQYMNNSPNVEDRINAMQKINHHLKTYITIEPIMKFDLDEFVKIIKLCNPIQVNIGADSGNNNLLEPTKNQINELINALNKFTKVHKKNNLQRILV